jgi:hypothetical protein
VKKWLVVVLASLGVSLIKPGKKGAAQARARGA